MPPPAPSKPTTSLPINQLTPSLGHNALVGVIEFYGAALADSERREKLYLATIAKLTAELASLRDAADRRPPTTEPRGSVGEKG